MKTLVVGLDGGAASMAALEWAARAVGRTGTIHAVSASSAVGVVSDAEIAEEQHLLERDLERWTGPIERRIGVLTRRVAAGPAGDLLRSEACEHGADALVVGAHMPSRFIPPTIGHTTRRLLDALELPLVVVPETTASSLDDGAPIVAGVGHSEATEAAVRWAAGLAEERGLSLGLVRATDEGPVFQMDGLLDLLAYYIDPSQRAEWDREDVEAMAGVAQASTSSAIEVEPATVTGHPGDRLVDASTEASLLVIGLHRPLVPGMRYTSRPLRQALTNAGCPVAVVPITSSEAHEATS